MENVRQHRDIKFVITEKRRKPFISEIRNKLIIIFFSENLSAIEMEQTKLHMNNLSIEDSQ